MKKIVYVIFFFLIVICNYSCEKDSLIEKTDISSVDEAKTRANYYCSGGGSCLPKVEVTGDKNSATVRWNGSNYNDHHITLSCDGASGNIYRSASIEQNGSWNFSIPDNIDGYHLSYTIRCHESQCQTCSKSGTFNKPSGNKPGSMGSITECFKKYLSYSIRTSGTKVYLSTTSPWEDVQNTEDYIKISKMKVYRSTSYGLEEVHIGGFLEYTPYNITLSFSPETLYYYEVHLFGEECMYPNLHYLSFKFNYISPDISADYSLQEYNLH